MKLTVFKGYFLPLLRGQKRIVISKTNYQKLGINKLLMM